MNALALVTRGYISQPQTTIVTAVEPDIITEALEPEINSRDTKKPSTIVDTVPDLKPVIKKPRRRRS